MNDKMYGEDYYLSHCGTPYTREEPHWDKFFGTVARNIDEKLRPATVFDAGCAIGFLVEALRKRGIAAFGRDSSEYAISQVPIGLAPFCNCGSIADPILGTFDLVTCVEVLEHMPEDEGRQAIASLCRASSQVLFSSSPTDFTEETHINVQPPLHWMELFAEEGFAPVADFDGSFLCAWAILFERRAEKPTAHELEAQSRLVLARMEKADFAANIHGELAALRSKIEAEAQDRDQQALSFEKQKSDLENQKSDLENQKSVLHQRLVEARRKPMRMLKRKLQYKVLRKLSKLSPPLSKRRAEKFARSANKRDPRRNDFSSLAGNNSPAVSYSELIKRWEEIRKNQVEQIAHLKRDLNDGPLISVVVPVYNPRIDFLSEMIKSVQGQSYHRWELCIADDCSSAKVRDFLSDCAANDPRIKLVLRTENGHISRATNSALEIASGEFIALLDHDDLLDQDALLLIAKKVSENPDAKIIYTDEDKIREDGERFAPHFKPDWNRDYLYCINYISHLGVYNADLVKIAGGFREGFEGAQDYDLLLRCLEHINDTQIIHIPKVLYSWRASAGSTAASSEAKPYASEAGIRALTEHLERVHGKHIAVSEGPFPFTYRVIWPLEHAPMVSIIIPTRDKLDVTKVAVESVLERTDYPNFEVLIVDNASVESKTLNWFAEIQKRDPRVRVLRDERPFNYSALNNAAIAQSSGELVALLNNDVEIIQSNWLQEMASLAVRPWSGCVGAKLYYPDGRIQHAGVVIGIGGVAGHGHLFFPGDDSGYFARLKLRQNYTAVTAACLVMRRSVYNEVGGLNETDLAVAFNDVDLCLKVQAAGYQNVWTPWAELMHYESASRGSDDTAEKIMRFNAEANYMERVWKTRFFEDPHYNRNLTLERHDFSFGFAKW